MDDWNALSEGLGRRLGPDAGSVTGIAYDSRQVQPGHVFVAIQGFRADGHAFIPQALHNGAGAVVVTDERAVPAGVPALVVADARRALAVLAARHYDHPSRELGLVGVTGTNGKTTTAYMVREVLSRIAPTGLIGTLESVVGGGAEPAHRTTPEAVDLERTLRAMRAVGDRLAVMEVSSEGIALHRPDELDFNVAVFTNLSREHLNFHRTMEAYFEAKAHLFDQLTEGATRPGASRPRMAVLNLDDPYGRRLLAGCRVPVSTFGIEAANADVRAVNLETALERQSFTLVFPGGSLRVVLQQGGRFNVLNALAAFAVGRAFGVEPEAAVAALGAFAGVPGRFEHVRAGQPFGVVVDYAHTPASLASILEAAREVTTGKLIVLFGCGGDRDRTKRAPMGAEAARRADVVMITTDNPRSEDPLQIMAQVAEGAAEMARQTGARVLQEPDRERAIRLAVRLAEPGDLLLLAGKGHETYQILPSGTIYFDDRAAARAELAALGYTADGGPA